MNETKTRKQYRAAAKLIIKAQASTQSFILLDYIYNTLGVTDEIARNGVLWAVQDLKSDGIIAPTTERGVYTYTAWLTTD